MEAQATGQAPAQAPSQVHPIHEETATIEALTRIVSNTPDNDPHEGTSMELPKEPPQEAPVEEAKAEEKPEETTFELDEEAPLFEVEYKTDSGKEQKKLSLKEMRDGYLRMQDYHRNIQKVKAEESALGQKAREVELKAQQDYLQKLEIHKQAVAKLAGVKPMDEIVELSKQDPATAQQEFLRMIAVNQTLQNIEEEQKQTYEKIQKEQQASLEKAKLEARETLERDIKGWDAEVYNKVLGTAVSDYGFKSEEVAPVVDARLIKVFHDAYQYRQLQKAKPEVSKKVVAVPKVVKPGSAQPQASSNAADEAYNRLKKSGRVEDAAEWYLAQQKQQKRK